MYSATIIKYYSAFISVSTSYVYFDTNNSIASVLCNITTTLFANAIHIVLPQGWQSYYFQIKCNLSVQHSETTRVTSLYQCKISKNY